MNETNINWYIYIYRQNNSEVPEIKDFLIVIQRSIYICKRGTIPDESGSESNGSIEATPHFAELHSFFSSYYIVSNNYLNNHM